MGKLHLGDWSIFSFHNCGKEIYNYFVYGLDEKSKADGFDGLQLDTFHDIELDPFFWQSLTLLHRD